MKATAKPEYDIARSCFAYEWDDATTNWLAQSSSTFIYDSWNMIQEIKLSALSFEPQTNVSSFVYGLDLSGSLQGAGGIGGLLASVSGTNAVCYTYDANGNVSEMLSALSSELSILAHYEYSPFGETIVATGELAKENPYRFSTKYTDDETKLVYYGYRFYAPSLGRWVSRDPIEEEGGINLFGFVENGPVDRKDRLGMVSCCGADHTEGLEKALEALVTKFENSTKKTEGCKKLFSVTGAAITAWDLAFTDARSKDDKCCAETVEIDGTCYNRWDVNYALWGLANQLCKNHLVKAKLGRCVNKGLKLVCNIFTLDGSGAEGTPDGYWEFSSTLTGWEAYGYDYPNGSLPATQSTYGDCKMGILGTGDVSLYRSPW